MCELSLYEGVNVAPTMCGAHPHQSHTQERLPSLPPCPLTGFLRHVSDFQSRANCLYRATLYRVNNMKFQDDFGYPF